MSSEKTPIGAGESSPAPDGSTITAKDGLLWRNGRIIDWPEADRVARQRGFLCAEELVEHLSNDQAHRSAPTAGVERKETDE